MARESHGAGGGYEAAKARAEEILRKRGPALLDDRERNMDWVAKNRPDIIAFGREMKREFGEFAGSIIEVKSHGIRLVKGSVIDGYPVQPALYQHPTKRKGA